MDNTTTAVRQHEVPCFPRLRLMAMCLLSLGALRFEILRFEKRMSTYASEVSLLDVNNTLKTIEAGAFHTSEGHRQMFKFDCES